MARGGVNKALVQKARASLLSRGENPSIDAVRIEMGNTGSKTTIHRYLKELESTQAPVPDINEELSDTVAHLAQRLQEQAQERIDQAHDQYQTERDTLQQQLAATQEQISQLEKHAQQRDEALEQQTAALLHTQRTLQAVQTEHARLLQANQDWRPVCTTRTGRSTLWKKSTSTPARHWSTIATRSENNASRSSDVTKVRFSNCKWKCDRHSKALPCTVKTSHSSIETTKDCWLKIATPCANCTARPTC